VVALVAFLTSNFFLSSQFDKQLWLLIALGPVLLAISRQPDPARDVAPA
jgi:hypothetical protein